MVKYINFISKSKHHASPRSIERMEIIPCRQGERFNPLNDFLFLKVMGEKGDEVQLLGFLNAVLGHSGENRFSSIEILENRALMAEIAGGKSSVLDVRAVLQGGTFYQDPDEPRFPSPARINIEVQIRNLHNMDRRSLYYWSREFGKSLEAGQDYRELPRVIAINIINFELFPYGNFHSCFHLREDRDNTLMTDALEIHYLDMVKWRKLSGKDVAHNPLHRWLAWLDPGSVPELVAEVVRMDNAILKANERQEHILSDEDALRLYEMRQLAYWDNINANEYAEEERKKARQEGLRDGRDEGLKEGLEKSRLEIAMKMKIRGLSLECIAEDTGLSLETVERL